MKIYMTDIVPFGDEKIFAQMLPFITEDRKNKIMQLKKKEDRCRSLAAGLLLEYALREYGISLLPGKMQQMYLRFGEKGKPVYILTCHIREDMWQVFFQMKKLELMWNRSGKDR